MEERLKVCLFTKFTGDACEYVRVTAPCNIIGAELTAFHGDDAVSEEAIADSDVVIVQRTYPSLVDNYQDVVKFAKKHNKPVIFEIDDYLFDLPEDHPDRKSGAYVADLLPMLGALSDADCVTVPTGILKKKLAPFNPNIFEIPNYIDENLWQINERISRADSHEQLVIGYMGSYTHQSDLESIIPALVKVAETYKDKVKFKIWGVPQHSEALDLENFEYLPAISSVYTEFAEQFKHEKVDIFIAPLVKNEFNRAKSHLKYLEYSSMQVPGIFANLEPYSAVVSDGINGFLAATQDEWYEKLSRLIEDPDLRIKVGKNAYEDVMKNWSLSKNRVNLSNAYKELSKVDRTGKNGDSQLIHSVAAQISDYLEQLSKERFDLETQYNELGKIANEYKRQVIERDGWIEEKNWEINQIKTSKAWKLAMLFQKARMKLAPPNSKQSKLARKMYYFVVGQKRKLGTKKQIADLKELSIVKHDISYLDPVPQHKELIDIIVCVHNALEDVDRCLNSILNNTSIPYRIILVDDGSDSPTELFLKEFKENHPEIILTRNDEAKGYTLAANIGIRTSTAPYFILLNSDTIVTPGWADRLYRTMQLDDSIAVVGPLSNTASWQSIPRLSNNGDWANNSLPQGVSIEKMAGLVAEYSGYLFPEVPLLNGFCLMIRQDALEKVGLFDEESFGQGYGEEDDFNLRVGYAGLKKVIADDTYIYHAQSKSYSSEKRMRLSKISGENLKKKHGLETIETAVSTMYPSRLFEGIRSRAGVMLDRNEIIEKGKAAFHDKKILFVLPVMDAGGGANVILDEALCMQKMGVDVRVFNLPEYMNGFLQSYKHSPIPFVFESIEGLRDVAKNYDAVIASAHYSVPWFKPLETLQPNTKLGYYIQGFEALMYPEGSREAQVAIDSYTLVNGMIGFTKTKWTKEQINRFAHADPEVIGISVNIDLFRPRLNRPLGKKPVHIAAMIRPSSPYRNPEFTARILMETKKKFGSEVEITLFGANDVNEIVPAHLLDFEYRKLGKLTQLQVSDLMSNLDIFTDFSSHQAMGLSALEAMASGATVIVPENGGAVEFIDHRKNGFVVDTSNYEKCLQALSELIENDELRKTLQLSGINDVSKLFPERCAYNILKLFFGEENL